MTTTSARKPEVVSVRKLDEWAAAALPPREPVKVRGGFRGRGSPGAPTLEIFELDGPGAGTVRILIPERPPIQPRDPGTAAFSSRSSEWWNAWASVLAATALVPPVVDPKRLADLLREERRLRLCCDTNALANGVASWLLLALDRRADIVTSAVVDRELAAWPDRDSGMWRAKTVDLWARRTRYRLARRLTETPPSGVVIDRLSPEQGALMLAKLRDETEAKSPDADMLLIELARGLVRDQPRNARVVYLTGDRNNARAATNALGGHNVLYAAADLNRAKDYQGRAAARGWWRPDGPLGAVVVPGVGRLLWDLLSACDFLVLAPDSPGSRWLIRPVCCIENGAPSDWEDPWVEIEDLSPAVTTDTVGVTSVIPTPGPPTDASAGSGGAGPSASERWLLHPVPAKELLAAPPSWRPTPLAFFARLWQAIGRGTMEPPVVAEDARVEALKLLVVLGAVDESGGPGPRVDEFRTAWYNNDLDWFHAELQRLPGYKDAMDRLRTHASSEFSSRSRTQVSMACCLGQVARLDRAEGGVVVGDAPVRAAELRAALQRWMPGAGDTVATDDLCRAAASELRLTPTRLAAALERLWVADPNLPWEGRTGGTVSPGYAENVVVLDSSGYVFRSVAPGALSFGRGGPVRFVMRTG